MDKELEEKTAFFKLTDTTLPLGAGFSLSDLPEATSGGRAEEKPLDSQGLAAPLQPRPPPGRGDNEVREDGSLMGQAQVLQADALQEMGIKSRSQSPVMTELDLNRSFIHLSICPGNITRAPTMRTTLCQALWVQCAKEHS